MQQAEVFEVLKERIQTLRLKKQQPIRVAINGIEGTGKTTLALNFTEYLQKQGLNSIHISIDGFHNPKAIRYKQGRDSAKGYYEDSYDEATFVEKVLLASQQEPPFYVPATHDLETDEYLENEPIALSNNAIIITDGAYLFKPNYVEHWDFKIYLKTDFETALNRGANRDSIHLGGMAEATQKYTDRYHKASKLYIDECSPELLADVIIDNTDFENLKFILL